MLIWDLIDSIKCDGVPKTNFIKIKDQWNRFQEGKEVDTRIIPSDVLQSWIRSRELGIDPYNVSTSPVDPSLKKELQFFHDLRQHYAFFFENVLSLFDHDEFSFAFRTKDGLAQTTLNKVGLSYPESIGDCTDKIVGTSAASFVMSYNRPVIFLHPYTWRQDYFQDVNCVGAPIHNEKNEIIGQIGFSFRYPELSMKAFHLITLLAKVFDSLYVPLTIGHEKHVQQIINCLPQGIAYINEKDSVKVYNERLANLLEVNGKIDMENELRKYLPKLSNGVNFNNKNKLKNIKLTVGDKEVEMQVSCHEVQEELTAQQFRLIQFQEKISREKYMVKRVNNGELFTFEQIIGSSPLIAKAKKISLDVAKTSVPVMIHGESGTGKEMFAQAIHSASPRRDRPFIAINCGAIPGELVESELFGYEEGSFTGALKGGKIGKIEAASGGTLFLDEIESMPLKDQIKLLRVLSTGKVQKVGSTKEISVDIRLISATKVNLLNQADEGRFREDLYYRISTFVIELPPLRKRQEDIIPLAENFIAKLSSKYSLENVRMGQSFISALHSYTWRGNVREMEHAMERAIIILGEEKTLLPDHLSDIIQDAYQEKTAKKMVDEAIDHSSNAKDLLSLAEKMVIEHVLELVDGNVSAAAKQLGVSRRTIYNKLQ